MKTTSLSNNQNNQQTTQSVVYQNRELESFIESAWISIKDGETKVLEFIPEKTKIVDKADFNGKPTKRVLFVVIEINDMSRKEKNFEVSKMHVGKIYEELKKGRTILEISRLGSGKDTRYFVKAVR